MKVTENYKRVFYIGIVIIALGITFSTTMKDSLGSLGTVFIAIGGLLFIVAMKKKQDQQKNQKEE